MSPGRNSYIQVLRNFVEDQDDEDDYDEEEWFPDEIERF
jgi:hypothetical protein